MAEDRHALGPTGRVALAYPSTNSALSDNVRMGKGMINPYMKDRSARELMVMDNIDLMADLNAQDDDGLGWSTLADARVVERIVAGAMVLAGNAHGQAVVRITAVDDDGQVHFTILPGSVAKNRHLLGRTVA